MPRTVEGIVQCHEIARERVRRGKPAWEGSLQFMKALAPLVTRYEDGDTTLTAQLLLDGFRSAAKEVRAKVPQAQGQFFAFVDDDLEHFVLSLEEMTPATVETSADIVEEFNDALDRLYDWCDVNRWWIEPA